jgi:hydroxyacylglutathione hydrolase
MIIETFPVGRLQCNCTVLGDKQTQEAIVIDPGDNIPKIMAVLLAHGLTVKQILVTHANIDHIAGAQMLKDLTGAPVLYNQADLALVAVMDTQAKMIGAEVPDVRKPDADLRDGLTFGVQGVRGTVIHTPGHTPGSVCLYVPDESLLLAGDTLFAGSVGRSDFLGGDGPMLLRSIHERLMVLPETTRVIPGHGAETMIGTERETNPFL